MKYDYLIVGAGLFGAVVARELTDSGKKCLVIDKRNHIAGNVYTEDKDGIRIHKYGSHIFHTAKDEIWTYVNKFAKFSPFINSPMANYHDEVYSLPFNMITFNKMFGVITPQEAIDKIEEEKAKTHIDEPKNLEEEAINLVGTTIYEKLIRHYTRKQWGRDPKDLPIGIIKRLPLRFTYNNNYFNDKYQGIPENGYTDLVANILKGIDIKLETDFLKKRKELEVLAYKIIYTGSIDEYYDFKFGKLEYRSLRFEEFELDMDNYQGIAVFNYCDDRYAYTRIIEHKHFLPIKNHEKTYITKEYPQEWDLTKERYYPINNEVNNALYSKYQEEAKKGNKVLFGGRLGMYKYFDMDKTIEAALEFALKLK